MLSAGSNIEWDEPIEVAPTSPVIGKIHVADSEKNPSFSMARLLKLRKAFYEAIFAQDVCGSNALCSLPAIYAATRQVLQKRCPNKAIIEASLHDRLLGEIIDPAYIFKLAVLLAGNVEIYFNNNEAIPPWDRGQIPFWAPIEIVSVEKLERSAGRALKALSCAGPSSGETLTHGVSDRYLQFMLRQVGYPRFKKFYSVEILNMWFTAYFGLKRGRLAMVQFTRSSGQEKHNRELYKTRHGGCPIGRRIDCAVCPKGCDECHAAVRNKTLRRPDETGDNGAVSRDG